MQVKFLKLTALILMISSPAFKASADSALLMSLTKNINQAYIANFESLTSDGFSLEPIKASGKIYYKPGGLVRFEYTHPEEYLIIIGKEKIWIYDPEFKNVTISNLNKLPAIDSLIFFRDPTKLKDLFSVINSTKTQLLSPMINQKLLFLKNVDLQSELRELQLAYNADTKLIEQLGVIDGQNNTRIFKFSEFEFPLDILDEKFEFIIPENVEIISDE